jgi:pectin methylesterase-like acyl-CoA thioesterase
MTLGMATLAAAGAKTEGILNITNGTVYANNIAVGANSVTNIINLVNGTLIVSNTLATNASGLFALNISNSTVGLTVSANSSLKGLVQTLNTTGATNFIQLNPSPVIFTTYPQQFPLIKFTTWTGSNTIGLASIPVWAPGATLVSNGISKSLDLSLPTDPRPVFTAQPTPFSGAPGANVTSSLSVSISAGSVTPVGYQWYYISSGNVTNLLSDGAGPSGSSTLTGSTTANLQVLNAQPGDSGNYFVVATNQFGTNSSVLALLTISASAIPPTVTGPAAVTATNGITTAIPNTVAGSPVPVLYWQYNGVPLSDGSGPSGSSTISGSSSSTLTISNPQYPGDQGTYSLIASNSAGLATNNTVLTVIVPPVITNQPVSLVVTSTQSASFTVVAGGVPSPTYQWYKNSLANPISGASNPSATTATLTIASASSSDTATYFVIIQNAAGSVTSSNVTLTVNSTMSATVLVPVNGATGVCYDTPLYITFSQAPTLRTSGHISIYNVTNSTTPVDVIDMGQGAVQPRTIAGETFNAYPVIITGNTAAIYPHLDLLSSNQTYYVTMDNGVFTDSTGAYFAGITANNTWQFTTKVGGPVNPANLVVAQNYSGDFATVQGALDSLPANNTSLAYVNVHNGIYTEIVEFKKNNVVLRGQSRSGTIIGYANNAGIAAGGGSTHLRMAMKVNASNIALDNLTVTNSTPQDSSQAEALMIESSAAQIIVNNCNVDSYQDTILANTSTSKAYFNNSLIQGDVDFIWGGGNLFFTNCEILYLIRVNNAAALGPNPSPAATDIGTNGFSFVNCALMTLPGANPNDTVGRTRGITNGNTALINCFISTNIGGWSADAIPTSNFRNWYYGCTNDLGASVTLSNGIALSSSDPNVTLASSSTAWLYGWVPALSPNITGQPVGQTVSAGQSASFTVSATGLPNPSYQWLFNGTPIPGATSATYNIASAARTNGGNYSVVASNGSGSVTSSVAVLTYTGNVAPVAGPASFTRNIAVHDLNIKISDLLTNVTDADGDPITLVSVGVSTNGVTPVINGNYIGYSNTNAVNDQFTYTVTDGFGGTNTGLITVNVSTQPLFGQETPAISTTSGTVILDFAGIPSYSYSVQRSTNVNFNPFDIVWTTNAPSNGLFQFIDVTPPQPTAFYRLQYNP